MVAVLLHGLNRHAWRSLASLAVGAAAGCASGGTSSTRMPAPMRTLAVDGSGTIQTNGEDLDRTRFGVSPDTLFRIALLAFPDIGVDPTVIDVQHRRIANPGFIRTRTLGATPLSRYLECGTNISGVRADNDRVTLVVDANIEPDGPAASRLAILVSATARSMGGSSTDPVDCVSTGKLEQSLRNAIGLRLARR